MIGPTVTTLTPSSTLDAGVRALRVVDLFSGLEGWSAPFRDHGHDVFSIDVDPQFDADAHLDISDVEAVLGAVPWRPDVVFASPPCNSFSTMTMGRMWTHEGEPKHPLAVEGRRLVLATLRIIAVLQPSFWVIENPRARLRTLDLLAGIPRVTISQCQYGTGRQKMTDLFGLLPPSLVLKPRCRNGDPCHVPAPRGSRTGTQGGLSGVEAAEIPYALADAFRVALEDDLRPVQRDAGLVPVARRHPSGEDVVNAGACEWCGQRLDERTRRDRRTCSGRCHMAAWRRNKARDGVHGHGADPNAAGSPVGRRWPMYP